MTRPIIIKKHVVDTRVVTVVVGASRVVTRVVTPYITIPVTRVVSSVVSSVVTTTSSSKDTGKGSSSAGTKKTKTTGTTGSKGSGSKASKASKSSGKGVRSSDNIIDTGGSAYARSQGGAGGSTGSAGVTPSETAGYWKKMLKQIIEDLKSKLQELLDKGYAPTDKIYGEVEDLIDKAKQLLGEIKGKKDKEKLSDKLLDKLKDLSEKDKEIGEKIAGLPNLAKPDINVSLDQDDVSDPDSAVLRAVGVWLAKKPVIEHYLDMAKYLLAFITAYAGHLTEDTYNALRKTVMDAITHLSQLENLVESGHFDPHDSTSLIVLSQAMNDVAAVKTLYDKFIGRVLQLQGLKLKKDGLAYKAIMGDKHAYKEILSKIDKCVEEARSSHPDVSEHVAYRYCAHKLGYDKILPLLKTIYDNLGKDPKDMTPGPEAKIRWGLDKLAGYVYLPLTLGNEAAQYLFKLADKNKNNPALSTAYLLLGLLAQAGGAIGTGAEAAAISALTGGVGLAVFTGIGLADLANQIAYYFTDPIVHDTVAKLIEDVKNGKMTAEEYGAIAGLLVTMAAMPLGDKLMKISLGGKLSVYDKILDTKKLVYAKILDKLEDVISKIKDKDPGLANVLTKIHDHILRKITVKIGTISGAETPEGKTELYVLPDITSDGRLQLTIFVSEKGRLEGVKGIKELDPRIIKLLYKEGVNPYDVQVEFARQIIRGFKGKITLKQLENMINQFNEYIDDMAQKSENIDKIVDLVNAVLKGRSRVGVIEGAKYGLKYLEIDGKTTGVIWLLDNKGKASMSMIEITREPGGKILSIEPVKYVDTTGKETIYRNLSLKQVLDLIDHSMLAKDAEIIDIRNPESNLVVFRSGNRYRVITEKGSIDVTLGEKFYVRLAGEDFDAEGFLGKLYVASKDGEYGSILAGRIKFTKKLSTEIINKILGSTKAPEFLKDINNAYLLAVKELNAGKTTDNVSTIIFNDLFKKLGNLGFNEDTSYDIAKTISTVITKLAEKTAREGSQKLTPVAVLDFDKNGNISIDIKMIAPVSSMTELVKMVPKEDAEKLVGDAIGKSGGATLEEIAEKITKETGLPSDASKELVEEVISRVVEKDIYNVTESGGGGIVTQTITKTVENQEEIEKDVDIPVVEKDIYIQHTEKTPETLRVTSETTVEQQGTTTMQQYIPVIEKDIYRTTTVEEPPAIINTTKTSSLIEPTTLVQQGVVVPVEKTIIVPLTIPVLKQVYVDITKTKHPIYHRSSTAKPSVTPPIAPWITTPGPSSIGGGKAVGGQGEEQYEVVQI